MGVCVRVREGCEALLCYRMYAAGPRAICTRNMARRWCCVFVFVCAALVCCSLARAAVQRSASVSIGAVALDGERYTLANSLNTCWMCELVRCAGCHFTIRQIDTIAHLAVSCIGSKHVSRASCIQV